jgi:hypothetical protein
VAVQSALSIGIQLIGDGVSKSFVFDITKAPVNVALNGLNPVGVQMNSGPAGATVSLSSTKITVTVVRATDIPVTGTTIGIILLFPSL